MGNGVSGKIGKRPVRHFALALLLVIVLAAGVLCAEAFGGGQEQVTNEDMMKVDQAAELADSFSLLGQPETIPESTKEIVNNVLLSDVPSADYSYSFNGSLDRAVVVSRQGDVDGMNDGTYPEADDSIMPLFVEGIEGSALYLDGNYGVELTDVSLLADSYTISFWFKAEELCDWSPFLVIGSHLTDLDAEQNYISINKKTLDEGEVVVPIFNTVNCILDNSYEVRPSLENKQCIDLGQWNYITVCVDGTQVSETDQTRVMGYLYLNSELIGSAEISKLSLDEEHIKAYVGINCFDRLFRASYDELHIWNERLNENQISAMYAAYGRTDS